MSSVKGKSVSEMQIGCENYFWTQYGVEVARLLKDLQNNLKENFFDNADGKVDQVNGSNEITDDSTQHAFSESASEEEECPPPFIQLEKWCIAINGQREGPFDSSTIKNLIVERNLSEIDCLVWEKSMENWCLMSKVAEFKDSKDITNSTSDTNSCNTNNSSISSEKKLH